MWRRRVMSILAGTAMVLAAAGLQAETAPEPVVKDQTPGSIPDLAGAWDIYNPPDPGNPNGRPELYFTKQEPSMQPWAQERYKENRKGQGEFRPDHGRADKDPTRYPYCMPPGFPRVYAGSNSLGGGAFEIIQQPGRVIILFQSNNIQRIFTDGRKLPKGPPLTFLGQSIGRYERDTLIVETKDLNELTWIDGMGHPHSDALRVEQRIRRTGPDSLEIDFLFDDPKAYTKPWTGKRVYKRVPKNDLLKDVTMDAFVCEDTVREDYSMKVLGENPPDDAWRQLRDEGSGY